MKPDSRHRRALLDRLRFLLRLLSFTAILVAVVTLFIIWNIQPEVFQIENNEQYLAILQGEQGVTLQTYALILTSCAGIIVLTILLEFLSLLVGGLGRRSLIGTNALLQIVLATAILIALNVYSFQHYWRYDLTREQQFTLPEAVVKELRKLQGETTIVVLQQHKTFGQLSAKPDRYDYAAERKIIEKIRDLVDQFRELGPRFRVTILDVEQEGFDDQLKALTENKPALLHAIQNAPENSIFFYANERVQRLSFNDFYQLDKTASRQANPNSEGKARGNLILRPQGVQSFVQRIFSIQEKRPKVAFAVIHEVLSSQAGQGLQQELSASGLRKTLEEYGFDVVDVILKKWGNGPPKAAAYNREENRIDRLENQINVAQKRLQRISYNIQVVEKDLKYLEDVKNTIDDVKKYLQRKARFTEFTQEDRRDVISYYRTQLQSLNSLRKDSLEDIAKLQSSLQEIYGKEQLLEDRRVTDLEDKFKRILSDCDMLIIPRMTISNTINMNENIPPELYSLSREQITAIKDFMKKGKPVFACLGPINDESGFSEQMVDGFERLLNDCGIELGKDTILYDGETESFALRQAGEIFSSSNVETQSVSFSKNEPKVEKKDKAVSNGDNQHGTKTRNEKMNPIGSAMRLTEKNVDTKLNIPLRYLRPIYLLPGWENKLSYNAEFVYSGENSWNEESPFPRVVRSGNRELLLIPEFDVTERTNPKWGTHEEERRGPFPVGVAIETTIPIEWIDEKFSNNKEIAALAGMVDHGLLAGLMSAYALQDKKYHQREKERIAVIGQGSIFNGGELSPARQKLLLHTCNWLLHRDYLLPNEKLPIWNYPRIALKDQEKSFWHWGAFLGLPLFFAYIGTVVLMMRRVR